MLFTFPKVSVETTGLVQCESGPSNWVQAIVPTIINGVQYDEASLQAEQWDGTSWATAKIEVKWANRNVGTGPWYSYSPAAEVTHVAANHVFTDISIKGEFLALICTAAESNVFLDLYLHLRKTH